MGRKAKFSAEIKMQVIDDYFNGKKSVTQILNELAIVKNSSGLPYHLGISVATYRAIIRHREAKVHDFNIEKTLEVIFKRFMKYLDRNEMKHLRY